MHNPGFSSAPLFQLASDMLFVAGAAGAMYADVRMHRVMRDHQGPGAAVISRKELYRLVIICLVLSVLIAAAMLLPIICGLNEPGGLGSHIGPQAAGWLVAAWVFNACGSIWAVLRLTRGQYTDRVRFGAAVVIALTSAMAALESYFWMIKPSALPQLIGPQLARGVLAALGIVCIIGVGKVAGDPRVGPLFEWSRLAIRAFGWGVIAANMALLTVVNVLALPITTAILPPQLSLLCPLAVTLLLGGLYYYRWTSIEQSRKITRILLFTLAIELAALWALVTYVWRH